MFFISITLQLLWVRPTHAQFTQRPLAFSLLCLQRGASFPQASPSPSCSGADVLSQTLTLKDRGDDARPTQMVQDNLPSQEP